MLLPLLILVCLSVSREAYGFDAGDEKDRVSYSIGYQVGGDFKRQGMEIDADLLLDGLSDALSGDETALTPEQMSAALRNLQRMLSARTRGLTPSAK